jgi:hypothetical protein
MTMGRFDFAVSLPASISLIVFATDPSISKPIQAFTNGRFNLAARAPGTMPPL